MVKIFEESLIQRLTRKRNGSIKIGETIDFVQEGVDWQASLEASLAPFVLLGIEEDIGTRAAGLFVHSKGVFHSTIEQFLNLQDNLYLSGADILLLGSIDCQDLEEEMRFLSNTPEKMYQCVEQLDERVYQVAQIIFNSGKTPIFIGGGQNNVYPILKALQQHKTSMVNAIAIAAHTCLAPPTGRTARNPYSYAILEDILHHYYVLGLHESEIPHSIYEFILANYNHIGFTRFEAILKNDPYLFEAIQEGNEFVSGLPFGLDINLNSVSDLLLSPDFPDGFLIRELRQLIRKVVDYQQASYLLLCEAKSGERNTAEAQIVGKSLALLVTDFIKSSTYNEEEEE